MIHLAKKTVRTIVICILLVTVPYILTYFYVNEKGNDILKEFLKENYNVDIEIGSLSFGFPLKVSLSDVVYKNISSPDVVVEFGGFDFSSNEFIVSRIYTKNLRINIDKNESKGMEPQDDGLALEKESPDGIRGDTAIEEDEVDIGTGQVNKIKDNLEISIKIKELVVDDGMIVFSDKNKEPSLRLAAEDIKAVFREITFPEVGKVQLDLTSSIRLNKKKIKDSLIISGWINWPKKDLDIYVKAERIDYFVFEDYLFGVWRPEELEVEEGVFSAGSHLVATNDELNMDYFVVIDKVAFKSNPDNESKMKSLKTVFAYYTRDGVTSVHFKHKTKLSKPKFTLDDLGSNILLDVRSSDSFTTMDSINRLVGRGQEAVEEGVGGIKGITIDPVVKALQSFGEELLGNVKKIFGIKSSKQVDESKKDIFQELKEESSEEEMFEKEDQKNAIEKEQKEEKEQGAIDAIKAITEKCNWIVEIEDKGEKGVDIKKCSEDKPMGLGDSNQIKKDVGQGLPEVAVEDKTKSDKPILNTEEESKI